MKREALKKPRSQCGSDFRMSRKQEWHITTQQEMDYSTECVEGLRKAGCATALIKKIDDLGGPHSPYHILNS